MSIRDVFQIDQSEFDKMLSVEGSDFKNKIFVGVRVFNEDLSGIDFTESFFVECAFLHCDLSDSNFTGVHTGNTGLKFDGCELDRAKFGNADLSTCEFFGCRMVGVDFVDAILARSFVLGCHVLSCDLSGAILTGACLEGSAMSGNNLNRTQGNGKEIRSVSVADWPCCYTATEIQLGCHRLAHDRMWRVVPDVFRRMAGDGAAATWERWREHMQQIVAREPATPTPDVPFFPSHADALAATETPVEQGSGPLTDEEYDAGQ